MLHINIASPPGPRRSWSPGSSWNRSTGEITFPIPKSKYNRLTRCHIPGAPKTVKLTGSISAARYCDKKIY